MIVEDLARNMAIDYAAVEAHSDLLAHYLPGRDPERLRRDSSREARTRTRRSIRVCVAADGFASAAARSCPSISPTR